MWMLMLMYRGVSYKLSAKKNEKSSDHPSFELANNIDIDVQHKMLTIWKKEICYEIRRSVKVDPLKIHMKNYILQNKCCESQFFPIYFNQIHSVSRNVRCTKDKILTSKRLNYEQHENI